jgi:hypothetical protein
MATITSNDPPSGPFAYFAALLRDYIRGVHVGTLARRMGYSVDELAPFFKGEAVPTEAVFRKLLDATGTLPSVKRDQLAGAHARALEWTCSQPLRTYQPLRTLTGQTIGYGEPEPLVRMTSRGRFNSEQPAITPTDDSPRKESAPAEGPPPLVEDADGHSTKPDPSTFTTEAELIAGLRDFTEWAGEYTARQLWKFSGKAVSHTTLHNLLAENPPKRPPLRMRYVQAVIRGCGGSEREVQRWTMALRRIRRGSTASRTGKDNVVLHDKTA